MQPLPPTVQPAPHPILPETNSFFNLPPSRSLNPTRSQPCCTANLFLAYSACAETPHITVLSLSGFPRSQPSFFPLYCPEATLPHTLPRHGLSSCSRSPSRCKLAEHLLFPFFFWIASHPTEPSCMLLFHANLQLSLTFLLFLCRNSTVQPNLAGELLPNRTIQLLHPHARENSLTELSIILSLPESCTSSHHPDISTVQKACEGTSASLVSHTLSLLNLRIHFLSLSENPLSLSKRKMSRGKMRYIPKPKH